MTRKLFIFIVTIICMGSSLLSSAAARQNWKGDVLVTNDGRMVGRIVAICPPSLNEKHTIKTIDENTYRVEWVFTARETVRDARLEVGFEQASPAMWWMIPSVSYNGNQWGQGHEPKGSRTEDGWWTFSYRRTPIPGAVYSESKDFAVATWSDVPKESSEDFSCGIKTEERTTVHRLLWPEEEMPQTYTARDHFEKGWQRSSTMQAGEKRIISMYISAVPVEQDHRAIRVFLDTAWKQAKQPKIKTPGRKVVWDLGIRYFKESLWAEEGSYHGFSIGLVLDKDGKWTQRPGGKYESGWCGQNISVGCSMLWDYLQRGDRTSLEKGLTTLDCWANNCRLPNGLFIVQYDAVLSGNPCRIDACNLGTTALNYLQAYNLAKECGVDRPQYRELAYDICDFVIGDQQENGCFGRGWTYDGKCIYREGTVGAFLIPALLEAFQTCKKPQYLKSAERAYNYYIEELRKDGYTTAGALDTWCVDKESSISILRSSLMLYQITHRKEYLQDAIHTSYYLSTWLWHYDEMYPPEDQFVREGYHTFGGTSVSVQHHHLDYYACLWIPQWLELARVTGQKQWKEKADAIWKNCCQLISDGSLMLNGHLRPAGSQNEAYFESSWGFGNEEKGLPPIARSNRINDWLVAWPGAFRLETIRKTSKKL